MGVFSRHRRRTTTEDGKEGKEENRKDGENAPVGGAGR